MIPWIAYAIARAPAAHLGPDLEDHPRRTVAGTEWELPIRQRWVLQPLMRAREHRKLRPGADGTGLGPNKYLVRCRKREVHFADLGPIGFNDDSLKCSH